MHLSSAGVSDKLLTRAHRFLPPSRCDKCFGSLWKSHIWVSILKKKNLLDIFLTYTNSQSCSEVVNIPLKKDIAYKRTKVFTLTLRNSFACKSWKQFMRRYTTRQTVLTHDVMGDTKLRGVWRSCEHLLRCTDFFALETFFQPCVGKRKTIQESRVHLLCKCSHSTI